MSGVVAVTLSPIMSAYMAPESGREGRFTRMVGHVFDRLRDGYGVLLDIVLRFRAQVLAFGAFICVPRCRSTCSRARNSRRSRIRASCSSW